LLGTFSPESEEIEGADGGPLRLDRYPARRSHSIGPVVLVHGFRAWKRWGFLPLLASRLAAEGFDAVAFSASGSGIADDSGAFAEPQRFRRNTYAQELGDLDRVVTWAIARNSRSRRASLVGHSRGGTLSILHAASDPRIACVAALAPQSRVGMWKETEIAAWERGEDVAIYDFRTRSSLPLGPDLWRDYAVHREDRYDVLRAAAALGRPLLLVHGARDRVVSPEHARILAERASPDLTELLILEGAGHSFQAGDTIRRTPPQLLEMIGSVTAWMRRMCGRDADGG